MLNFPVPYPDELIYSLVARAGIHLGLTSPKQLLDEVFANRHVIATVDLPNHLPLWSNYYRRVWGSMSLVWLIGTRYFLCMPHLPLKSAGVTVLGRWLGILKVPFI
ncbi:TniQ family protein [Aeromonas veronii]|uniref:TniQ family protein n=1 Tax=Aeromonas veronii TaxID=654 RepID=UPI0039824418